MSLSSLFILIAILCFILAALGVPLGSLALVPLGLAFFAAGHLPWAGRAL